MQDREVVAAIVAGDPRGIAEAYDTYAMPLYSYCRSLLREPEDAADAVQDTFLIATAKLGGLRDPGKLRSWLYAVARNECYRRRRSGEATSALDEAVDMPAAAGGYASTAESVDVASAVERAEVHQLVRDAINGLNPGEQDVIQLSLVQGLDHDELADALGVSRNHAHALQSRARSQLERSLGALIVARTGRGECTALDGLLAGWDGQMTPLLRKRVSRHIDQCETCGERKRRELTPALFAGVLPLVALVPGFREHVLKMCADGTAAGLAHRAAVAARAGQFGPAGFPRPGRPPGVPGWHTVMRHSHALAASAATAAAAAGVSAVLIIGGGPSPSHRPGRGPRQRGSRRGAEQPRRPLPRSGLLAGRRGQRADAVGQARAAPALALATGRGSHAATGRPGSASLHLGVVVRVHLAGFLGRLVRARRVVSAARGPGHPGRVAEQAGAGGGQRPRGRDVHADRQGRPGQLHDRGRRGPHHFPRLGIAGRRGQRDDHRDLLQPDLAGRAAHGQPGRLHGHRGAEHLAVARTTARSA